MAQPSPPPYLRGSVSSWRNALSLSLYDASIPGFIRSLRNLSSFLDKAEAHAKAAGADFQTYLDARLDFMASLRIDTLPTTILYDAQGREVWRMTGMAEWDDARAARLIAEASAG